MTYTNFVNADGSVSVFGNEVGDLMSRGWTLDIENSMLWAPEAAEGEEAVDLLFLLFLF